MNATSMLNDPVSDVTIISIYYNRAYVVAASTESLLAQDHKPCAIILVDDGSTDSTHDELLAYSGDERVSVISQDNRGFTTTLKAISETVTTEFVAIHASGDLSVPDRISEQVKYMRSNPTCGLVGGHVLMKQPDGSHKLIPAARDRLRSERPLSLPSPLDHSTFFIRTSALRSIGGYRTEFEYAQDFDLLLRMSRHWRIAALDKAIVECHSYMLIDGVRVDPRKRIKQKYYVELAIQADEGYRRHGVDIVSDWGRSGVFFRKRTARIRRRFLMSFLRAYRRRDWHTALLNLQSAQNESGLLYRIFLAPISIIIRTLHRRAKVS